MATNLMGLKLLLLFTWKMRKSCVKFRAVCLLCALQCLAAGDKGSPFSQWSMKMISKHSPVVSGKQNCFGFRL